MGRWKPEEEEKGAPMRLWLVLLLLLLGIVPGSAQGVLAQEQPTEEISSEQPADYTLEVVDVAGAPVEGITLAFVISDQTNRLTTEDNGRIRIQGVSTGRIHIVGARDETQSLAIPINNLERGGLTIQDGDESAIHVQFIYSPGRLNMPYTPMPDTIVGNPESMVAEPGEITGEPPDLEITVVPLPQGRTSSLVSSTDMPPAESRGFPWLFVMIVGVVLVPVGVLAVPWVRSVLRHQRQRIKRGHTSDKTQQEET